MSVEAAKHAATSSIQDFWSLILRVVMRVPRPLLLAMPFCLVPLTWTSPRLLIQTADYNNPLNAGRLISHILAGWNPDNLGSPTYREVPLLFPYLGFWGLGQAFSIPIEMVQRLWLCGLIALAMVSAWSLIRLISPSAVEAGWWSTVAVLAFVFNPFTLTYWAIGAQTAFLAYAVAPLWLATLIRTVRGPPSLTSGAPLALVSLLFASAFNNPPIVVTMIALPSLLACAFLMATREVRPSRLLVNLLSAFGWFSIVNAWWLVPLSRAALTRRDYFYAGSSADLLSWPNLVNRVDFWEFVRGTGYWGFHAGYRGVPYFAWAEYLADPIVILATFWLAACVFLPLLLTRKLSTWTAFPVVLFVISVFFAKATNPPLAAVNRWLYLEVPGFFMFRSAYEKFAGLSFLALVVALAWLLGSWGSSGRTRNVMFAVTGCAVALSALPLFIGTVIQERTPSGVASAIRVPSYYERLAKWSGEQRVGSLLVVPQTPSGYVKTSWGFAGADIIQEYSSLPAVIGSPGAAPGDGPTFSSFLRVVNDFDQPLLLRRYGITHVLVRGDIDSTYYPGTLEPKTVAARLRAAGFPLARRMGQFQVFAVPAAVSQVWAAGTALAPTSWSVASERLLLSYTKSPIVQLASGPTLRSVCLPDPVDLTHVTGSLRRSCGVAHGLRSIVVLSQRLHVAAHRHGDRAILVFSSRPGIGASVGLDAGRPARQIWIPLKRGVCAIRIGELTLPLDQTRVVSGDVTLHPGTVVQLLRETSANLVDDGSFETEAFPMEGEGRARIISKDATDGRHSLEVISQGKRASTFRTVEPFMPGSSLAISFDYRHVKGGSPAFGLWQGGVERYADKAFALKQGTSWHHYRALVLLDPGATVVDAFFYSFPQWGSLTINRYDNLVVREVSVAHSSFVTTVGASPQFTGNKGRTVPAPHSLIVDGSFERTLWNGANVLGDDTSIVGRADGSSDAAAGQKSLQVTAVNGEVSTSREISSYHGDAIYRIRFAYRHVAGNPPAFGVWDKANGSYLAKEFELSSDPRWHRFETVVWPGLNASNLSIFFYSFAGDDTRTVNRYDDVRINAAGIRQEPLVLEGGPLRPDPVAAVQAQSGGRYEGTVREVAGHVWIVLPQSFDDRWQLDVQSTDGSSVGVMEHVRVDGFGNGWLVRGHGDLRFSIGFVGSSDVALGSAITVFGLGLLLALSSWRLGQRYRPRRLSPPADLRTL